MKRKKSNLTRVLSLSLVIVMICVTTAFATVSYDSNEQDYSAGTNDFVGWSTLYIDSGSECRASAWIRTDDYKNVPAYTMGAYARVYSQATGNVIKDSQWRFNTTSDYFTFAGTDAVNHTGLVFSRGRIELYTGISHVQYDLPDTPYAMSGGSRAAFETLLENLQTTLDENGNYPTNALGQTYGSALLAEIVGVEPDLISAEGVGGAVGYVKADELNPKINSPAEAAAYMAALDSNRIIPLYDANGTVIGTFEHSKVEIEGSENMSLEEVQAAFEAMGK